MRKLAAITLGICLFICAVLQAQPNEGAFSGRWYSGVVHDTKLFNGDVFKRLEIGDDGRAAYTILGVRVDDGRRVAFVIMEAVGEVARDGGATKCIFKNEGFEFALARYGETVLVGTGVSEKDVMTDAKHSELSKLPVVGTP